MPLTVRQIERLNEPGRYSDGHGLYLRITPSGTKNWALRYEFNGRERMMGLGSFHAFNLPEARERARAARQQLADGVDPIAAKAEKKAAEALAAAAHLTFKDAAKQYYAFHESKWRNRKHAAQFLSTLETYAYPVIGNLRVADIETSHIFRVLDPIWKIKTETASRVRSRIENVLTWATVRGHRSGDNPARWRGHLREALPSRQQLTKVRHHPALPFVELPAFVALLRARDGMAARALELTILTAARTGEITGARWDEFDLEAKVWVVPAERMKAGKEHRVPLSPRACQLLAVLPREGEFVFPGPRKGAPLSNMAMAAVLKRMEVPSDRATVHGFRSTFRDWAAERTSYPNEMVEMALAHTIKNHTEAAYRRGDLLQRRAKLMADWATFCSGGKV